VVRPEDGSSFGAREIGPHLHHVAITTDQLMRSSEFYERAFGLAVAYDYAGADEPAKLRFLADGQFVSGGHEFLLELMGPPFLDREAAAFDRWGGACFDHYCFTTGDPAELHAACLAAGCRSSEEPVFVEDFDLTLSYLFGPDDVEIELMDPPSADTIALPG
jgi:catechol 2,3-dioxygenase-like lactoylglutathione lyase family enzyme